jgi:cellulose biosynthesis protein BcsQ
MPVITFANTKGGAGKTTVALILAGELLRRGYRVTMLDADPQQWISRWHRLAGTSAGFDVIGNVDADTIEGQVKDLNSKQTYIIIDLPGGLTPLLAKALGLRIRYSYQYKAALWMRLVELKPRYLERARQTVRHPYSSCGCPHQNQFDYHHQVAHRCERSAGRAARGDPRYCLE